MDPSEKERTFNNGKRCHYFDAQFQGHHLQVEHFLCFMFNGFNIPSPLFLLHFTDIIYELNFRAMICEWNISIASVPMVKGATTIGIPLHKKLNTEDTLQLLKLSIGLTSHQNNSLLRTCIEWINLKSWPRGYKKLFLVCTNQLSMKFQLLL